MPFPEHGVIAAKLFVPGSLPGTATAGGGVSPSNQTRDYQKEMAGRLHLPFAVSSDHEMKLANALDLHTFKVAGMTLLKRLTLICRNGLIEAVHYPVLPTGQDPVRVMDYLKKARVRGPKG